MTSQVGLLRRELVDRATTTLERAFLADPMFTWIFPDPGERARSLRRLNRVPLEYGLRYGRVTEAGDGQATAIWIPPGRAVTAGGMIRSGMLGVPLHVGLRPFAAFMRANATMERIHKTYVPEPHWYLLVVGVDPALQGCGVGTALVEEGLARADETGAPCYLETSEARNLPFYERHGFVVVASVPLGDGGPTAWGMRREPRGVRR